MYFSLLNLNKLSHDSKKEVTLTFSVSTVIGGRGRFFSFCLIYYLFHPLLTLSFDSNIFTQNSKGFSCDILLLWTYLQNDFFTRVPFDHYLTHFVLYLSLFRFVPCWSTCTSPPKPTGPSRWDLTHKYRRYKSGGSKWLLKKDPWRSPRPPDPLTLSMKFVTVHYRHPLFFEGLSPPIRFYRLFLGVLRPV